MVKLNMPASHQQKNNIVVNAFEILNKVNNTMNNMAQTMNAATDYITDSAKSFDKLADLAFESNVLALKASLNEAAASEIGEGEVLLLARKVNDIAMKAADTTRMLHGVADACRQARRCALTSLNKAV